MVFSLGDAGPLAGCTRETEPATHSRHSSPKISARTISVALLDGAGLAQRGDFSRVESEQVAEHPVGVLAERRARAVVARLAVREAEAVALVQTGSEERVLVRLEVPA